jgi:uncharacterized membrane protein
MSEPGRDERRERRLPRDLRELKELPGLRELRGSRERERERERELRAEPGRSPRIRLDQPRAPRRRLLPEYDPEAFGRLSERIARFLGTGRFIVWMTVTIVVWIGWNVFAPAPLRWDQYPFIFLTLVLSLQASYAAPLILLAQNRQDDRDRVNLEQDRKQNERSIADTEYLTREVAALRVGLGEVATRDWIRSELEELSKELAKTLQDTAAHHREVEVAEGSRYGAPDGDGRRGSG